MKPELRAVTSELPEPPYPATTKTGGFPFELDMTRILSSKTWLLATPDLQAWLLKIWSMSWIRVPSGSWPNDDEEIAAHLGCDLDWFMAHKKKLMRGWVLHNDQRLYHPIITEKVQSVLSVREKWARDKRRKRQEMSTVDSTETPGGVRTESLRSPPHSYSYSSSSSSSLRSEEREKPARRANRKTPTPIPHDWTPGQTAAAYIASFNASPQAQQRAIADFIAYWTAKGDSRANWDLAFVKNPVAKETLTKGAITNMPTRRRLGE